jgi:hypothetical protein
MFTLKVKDHPMYHLVPSDTKMAVAELSVFDESREIPFKCCFPLCQRVVPSTAAGRFGTNGWCVKHEPDNPLNVYYDSGSCHRPLIRRDRHSGPGPPRPSRVMCRSPSVGLSSGSQSTRTRGRPRRSCLRRCRARTNPRTLSTACFADFRAR